MIDRSELFLRTLQDLQDRIISDDPYVILGASALLRKLFLDHSTLVDSVNRVDHLRLRFRVMPTVVAPPGVPRPNFFSAQDGIDPDTSPPLLDQPVELTRAQFFSMVVLVVEGHEYTIADVIKFEANVMGAVHAGSPLDDKERALEEINQRFSFVGYAASLRQVQAIGRVVLRTLGPLREKVAQRNTAT